jgi:hypothetical protein
MIFGCRKERSDFKAERQVIGLVPVIISRWRSLRPQHTSTTFYAPEPVSNRVDCIVNRRSRQRGRDGIDFGEAGADFIGGTEDFL